MYIRMSDETPQEQKQCETGVVKWFNNKAGYGFITVGEGSDRTGEDVFVHHSGLKVEEEQYKYLVQGEYVVFEWTSTNNTSDHKWQATEVRGINNGKLMCETRNDTRSLKRNSGEEEPSKKSNYRLRGGGPRGGPRGQSAVDENGVEWLLVKKKRQQERGDSRPRQHRY